MNMTDEERSKFEEGRRSAEAVLRPGMAGGATAALDDRQRQILEHRHAKGRHRELAAHLAHKTDMPAPAAIRTMDAAELDAKREDRARGEG